MNLIQRIVLTTIVLDLIWDDFKEACSYWLPAWGTLEGANILWQPIILGLMVGFLTLLLVTGVYRNHRICSTSASSQP